MCGIVTPSAPASRISLTRALAAAAPVLVDRRDADDERLPADRLRALQALGDCFDRRRIVRALEVEEDEIVERIHRQLLAALFGVERRLHRPRPAPGPGGGAFGSRARSFGA